MINLEMTEEKVILSLQDNNLQNLVPELAAKDLIGKYCLRTPPRNSSLANASVHHLLRNIIQFELAS